MPMSYASQASATPSSGTQVVVAKPAGTVEGDVLIAMVSVRGSSAPTITPPAGWVSRESAGTAAATTTHVWTRIAGPSEPSTYTWVSNLAITESVGAVLRYSPEPPTQPPGVVDAAAMGPNVSPAVAPSVTATGNSDTLVALFSSADPGSTPAGMTERVAIGGGRPGVWAYDELLTQAGATGTRTWDGSGGDFVNSVGWSVALFAHVAQNRIRMMI